MGFLSWINFELFDLLPEQCIGNFKGRLFLRTSIALGLVVAGPFLCACFVSCKEILVRRALRVDSTRSIAEAALAGVPAAVMIAFALTPSISKTLFSTFDCEEFSANDASGASSHFLIADFSVRCSSQDHTSSDWDEARIVATGYIMVWPVGMPILFLALLLHCREAIKGRRWTPMTNATRFLHREYRPQVFYFEVVELLRRLVLTGAVLLIDSNQVLLRLLLAMLLTTAYLGVLQVIQPYQRADNNTLAVAAQVALMCCFTLASFTKIFKDFADVPSVGIDGSAEVMGFSDAFVFTAVVFAITTLIVGLLALMMVKQGLEFRSERQAQIARACKGITSISAPLVVVNLSWLRDAGKMIPHEEARDESALMVLDTWDLALEFATKNSIVFISHQWLGWDFPDPNGVHYPIIVEAAEALRKRLDVDADDLYVWLGKSCCSLSRPSITSRMLRSHF
jgi:hypothetical protein